MSSVTSGFLDTRAREDQVESEFTPGPAGGPAGAQPSPAHTGTLGQARHKESRHQAEGGGWGCLWTRPSFR